MGRRAGLGGSFLFCDAGAGNVSPNCHLDVAPSAVPFAYLGAKFGKASRWPRRSEEMVMLRLSGGSRAAALLTVMGLSVALSVFGCSAAESGATDAFESTGSIGLALQAG